MFSIRRSIRLSLDDFLVNAREGNPTDDWFIIYYNDGTQVRIGPYDDVSGYIRRQGVKNIEWLSTDGHTDFFNMDLDTYGSQPFGYYGEING